MMMNHILFSLLMIAVYHHHVVLAAPLKVIGLGYGRTGTDSLLSALLELGFGPTYHMREGLFEEQGISTEGHFAMFKSGKSALVLFHDKSSCVQYKVSTTWLFYLTLVCLY